MHAVPSSAISLDGLGFPRTAEDAYRFIVYLPVYKLGGLCMRAARVALLEHGILPSVSCAFLQSPKYS